MSEDETEDYSMQPKIIPQLLVSGTTSPTEDLQRFLDFSPNMLVSTPGRLLELLSSPRVHCPQSSFEVLILDEADRLLDLGFKEDLQKILGQLPKQRRTGLFSASVSEALDQLIRVGLRNPVHIAVKVRGESGKPEKRTPSSLQMSYVIASASQQFPTLLKILTKLNPTPQKTIIYLSTCAAVDYFQHVLTPIFTENIVPYTLISLHGKHTPQVRQKNFSRFSDSLSPSILLTTDVAARGLDIPQVDLVVQIDPPLDPKVFLHRCGRAGRAGRKGLAILFLRPGREEDYVSFLEVRKTPISPFKTVDTYISLEEASTYTQKIRDIVLQDRALHDKAQRAFVSGVQAYRKHQAKSIFQLADLDWRDLADGWGLLKMPRMPELKGWEGDPTLGLDVDFEKYKYGDKRREEQRVKKAEAQSEETSGARPTQTKRSWSDTLDQKSGREKKREQKKAKKERLKWESMTTEEREKQAELERLIETAKRQRLEDEVEFEGFSD
jgi:ATP-dependent RNA helicase DDX55/SPB4